MAAALQDDVWLEMIKFACRLQRTDVGVGIKGSGNEENSRVPVPQHRKLLSSRWTVM